MTDYRSFIEILHQRALYQPSQKAYTFLADGERDEKTLNYEELNRRARTVGAMLQSLGAMGERVLLLYPPGLEYIVAFYGCLYAGAIAVPSYPPRLNRPDIRLQTIVQDSGATIAITTHSILSNLERRFAHMPGLQHLRWIDTDEFPEPDADEWWVPEITPSQTAFLQYTSGSTSTPKGVVISHANLLHNSAMIQRCFGHSEKSRGVIWLPPYHDMGLIGGILQPLYVGFPVVLMSPTAFLQKPLRWLDAISRYRATTSGGPNFAYDLCVDKILPEERGVLDLSSWDLAFNGAEPVRSESIEKFVRAFGSSGFQRRAFYPCYGLAEATLIVSGGDKADAPVVAFFETKSMQTGQVVPAPADTEGAQGFVGCGKNLPEQKLAIVDPDTHALCAPDRVGEVWVKGPSVAHGYWNLPEETKQTFAGRIDSKGDGAYLRTGDLGFIRDGELFIVGRSRDLIIIRGRNYHPQDIEAVLESSHPAVQPGGGAAFSIFADGEERLAIVQEVRHTHRHTDGEDVIRAIRAAVSQGFELQAYSVVLVKPTGVPKTSSGKIQRQLCRTKFLEDQLDVIHKSTLSHLSADKFTASGDGLEFLRETLLSEPDIATRKTQIGAYLQEQVARLTGAVPSAIDIQEPISAFGIDSLMVVDLLHTIETQLAVRLPLADLLAGMRLSELAEAIVDGLADSSQMLLVATGGDTHTLPQELPLSYGQKAIWFLHQFMPASAAYHIACAIRIHGTLDMQALQRAFEKLVERHASLRTTFSSRDGEPFQTIWPRLGGDFFFIENAVGFAHQDFHSHLSDLANEPFDLEQGPLLRVRIFCGPAEGDVLLFVVHHIVADFWSLAVLLKELERFYSIEQGDMTETLPSLSYQYADFIHWQIKNLDGLNGERMWDYWQKQLAGKLPFLQMPTDSRRQIAQTDEGASIDFEIPIETLSRLKAFCRARGVTLYMMLFSVFQVLLHVYTGQEEIVTGSPVANRESAGLAGLVGYFINAVALRTKPSRSLSFNQYLDQTRQTILDAFANQEYPFELLVERLHPDRSGGHSPIFQAMFTLQQAPATAKSGLTAFAIGKSGELLDFADLRLEPVILERRSAQFDLSMVLAETSKELGGYLQYRSALFNPATVERMAQHFLVLLESILADSQQPLSMLSLLTPAEEHLVRQWNATATEYPSFAGFHELICWQARQTPGRLALSFEGHSLTYAGLDRCSNQWARYLQKLGVRPGVLVGVFLDRSLEMPVVLLGILKAGGAYVPLDPEYPEARLSFMVNDSRLAVLVVQEDLIGRLPAHVGQVVGLERDRGIIEQQSDEPLDVPLNADDLAYIIYTSGSTGLPKGVQIPHRAVSNFLLAMRDQPWLSADDQLLAITTLCFDIAILELFLPLTVGANVVLASRVVAANGAQLIQAIEQDSVSIVQATPATWRMLIDAGWQGRADLKVLCGGETLPGELAEKLLARSAGVWNLYGPTEATVWATVCRVDAPRERISIGRPIANLQVYVLDSQLRLSPVGVVGEIYIGGTGLARGYLNRSELTADRFVPHPLSQHAGERLYRTGDLARYLADGEIDFLGRADHQVKIRGYRIELGEIETALSSHVAIKDVVVVGKSAYQDTNEIVAYIVFKPGQYVSLVEMRSFLKERLPEYMIPAFFVAMDALPLTPNRKVDRNALPDHQQERMKAQDAHTPPRTDAEKAVATIWQDVLQIKQVGVDDNFFELGGHSLLAAKMVTRLQQVFAITLSLQQVFETPTVAQLAVRIEQIEALHEDDDELTRMLEMVEQLSDAEVLIQLNLNDTQGEGDQSNG